MTSAAASPSPAHAFPAKRRTRACENLIGDDFIEPPQLFPEIRLTSLRKARRGRYASRCDGVNERKSAWRPNVKIFSNPRFLVIYSGVVTAAFAITLLCGFAALRSQTFDVLTVHRINFVEPDGTPRLIISDRESFPGAYMRGKEYPRPDRREAAGMIFMNDEGSEMGGLIFGGLKMKDGTIQNHGHLSFDQYEQDQIFAVDSGREDQDKFSAIRIGERGDYPIQQAYDESLRIDKLPQDQQDAEWKKFFSTHTGDANRIYLGRSPDKSASLRIKDSAGHDRLVLRVNADGAAVVQFLDADGKVVNEITATK